MRPGAPLGIRIPRPPGVVSAAARAAAPLPAPPRCGLARGARQAGSALAPSTSCLPAAPSGAALRFHWPAPEEDERY